MYLRRKNFLLDSYKLIAGKFTGGSSFLSIMSDSENTGNESWTPTKVANRVMPESNRHSKIQKETRDRNGNERYGNQYRGSPGRTVHGRNYHTGRGRWGKKETKQSSNVDSWRSRDRLMSAGIPGKIHGRGGYAVRGRREPHKRNESRRKVQVILSDFNAFHQSCQAARYKVHKPGCTCSKVEQVRSLLRQQFEKKEGRSCESDAALIELDGLVVVPDMKNIPSVYLCPDDSANDIKLNRVEKELLLKEEIFGKKLPSTGPVRPFKVSCAMCLLVDEPNGFACVASSSSKTVDFVRDMARRQAAENQQKGALHADHAHHLCSLPRNILWNLWSKARTRDQKRKASNAILELLEKQGVPINSDCRHIELQHHLTSLLQITKEDSNASTVHWLAMVYDDTAKKKDPCWSLDLPGGKRHLGENSVQGMIRETEEETSLIVNNHWMLEDRPRKGSGRNDWTNVYYMIGPPSDILMEAVEQDTFWDTEKK